MRSLPLEDAADRLGDLVAEVRATRGRVVLTRHGVAEAVLISVDDLAALEESVELVATGALVDGRAARLAYDEGRTTSLDELKSELEAGGGLAAPSEEDASR
ncbi:type II toxin-antitoxin system Phd/YefM family antitoxin [Cellulomonas marina]|uniref:Antitoxin n=1 Tax=Cellulomonas marina TaxID=988821 RepID=A0A1I1AGW0_9CELL|nr:type II toxin-antitoxin system Phd/YefM family antitoxin [Cellulomonas marina]SFB37255.1 prevent-host-death family protein [Cellulomonas marina]